MDAITARRVLRIVPDSPLTVELAFTDDVDAILPEHVETIEKQDVLGNEATVVVFGNDEHAYGWINQVICLDAS